MTLYFEDFAVGDTRELGGRTVSEAEIVAFGRQFDPQPFHIDPEAASRSPFGGLIASGWHTAALAMRMVVDELLPPGSGSLGSPGVDELRWHHPVRPGDTLRVRTEVVETVPSRSKPDRGLVKLRYRVLNQRDEEVMSLIGMGLFRRRSALTAAP